MPRVRSAQNQPSPRAHGRGTGPVGEPQALRLPGIGKPSTRLGFYRSTTYFGPSLAVDGAPVECG